MILLKYWNPKYQIAMADWQNAWQFPEKEKMQTEIYRGALYYRLRGSARRISYLQLKKGLQRKSMGVINELLPF
ncbi:MAG: hypothetical protein ACT4OJ_02850 [Bacteroidota bacterium]